MKKQGYQVNEQFDSIQGEGLLTGTLSTFIRLQGCPVGCEWCDSGPLADELEGKRRTNGMTANTWGAGGEWKTLPQIMEGVHQPHVILTGGEPTIWNLDLLITALKEKNCSIQLETAGLNALKGNCKPDWVTWSPKQRIGFGAPAALKKLVTEVKFVVDEHLKPIDVQKIADYFYYDDPGHVRAIVFMPEGSPPGKEAIDRAIEFMHSRKIDFHGMPVRFGWRLQYSLNMR